MSDTPHYALSQDYELMFSLLENGPLLGFVDYEHGSTLRDPVQIKRVADGKYFEYRAGVRGFGYINAFSKDAKEKFVEQCRKNNLSFIVPNADADARTESAIEERRILTAALLKTGCLVIPHGSFFLEDVPKIIGRTLKEGKEENERLQASKEEAIATAESAEASAEKAESDLARVKAAGIEAMRRAEQAEDYAEKLIYAVTDGNMSQTYDVQVVADEVSRIWQAYTDEKVAKAKADAESVNARLRAELETAQHVAASAQAVAQEAWAGEIPSPLPGHKRTSEEELLAQVEHLNCPLCGGSGHIGDCEGD